METFKEYITTEKNLILQPNVLMAQSKLSRMMFDQMEKFSKEANSETFIEFIFENAYDHNDWCSIRVGEFFSRVYNTFEQLHEKDHEIKIFLHLLFSKNKKEDINFFLQLIHFFAEFKNVPFSLISCLNKIELFPYEKNLLKTLLIDSTFEKNIINSKTEKLSVFLINFFIKAEIFEKIKSKMQNHVLKKEICRKMKLRRTFIKVRTFVKIEIFIGEERFLRQKLEWMQKLADLTKLSDEGSNSIDWLAENLKISLIQNFSNYKYSNLISLVEGMTEPLLKTRQEFNRFVKNLDKSLIAHLFQLIQLKEKSDLKKMKLEIDTLGQNKLNLLPSNLRLNGLSKDILYGHMFKMTITVRAEREKIDTTKIFERFESFDRQVLVFLKKTENQILQHFEKLVKVRNNEIEEMFEKIHDTQFMDDFVDFFKSKIHKIEPHTRLLTFISPERHSFRTSMRNSMKTSKKDIGLIKVDKKPSKFDNFEDCNKDMFEFNDECYFSNLYFPHRKKNRMSLQEEDVNQAILQYVSVHLLGDNQKNVQQISFEQYIDEILNTAENKNEFEEVFEKNGLKIEKSKFDDFKKNIEKNVIIEKQTKDYLTSWYENSIKTIIFSKSQTNFEVSSPNASKMEESFEVQKKNTTKSNNSCENEKAPEINWKGLSDVKNKDLKAPEILSLRQKIEKKSDFLQVPEIKMKYSLHEKYFKNNNFQTENELNAPIIDLKTIEGFKKYSIQNLFSQSDLIAPKLNFKKSKIDNFSIYEHVDSQVLDENGEEISEKVILSNDEIQLTRTQENRKKSQKLLNLNQIDKNGNYSTEVSSNINNRGIHSTGDLPSTRFSLKKNDDPIAPNLILKNFPKVKENEISPILSKIKNKNIKMNLVSPVINRKSLVYNFIPDIKFDYSPNEHLCGSPMEANIIGFMPKFKTQQSSKDLISPTLNLSACKESQNSNPDAPKMDNFSIKSVKNDNEQNFPNINKNFLNNFNTFDQSAPKIRLDNYEHAQNAPDAPVFNLKIKTITRKSTLPLKLDEYKNLQLNFKDEKRASFVNKNQKPDILKAPKMEWKVNEIYNQKLIQNPEKMSLKSDIFLNSGKRVIFSTQDLFERADNKKEQSDSKTKDNLNFFNSAIFQTNTFTIENIATNEKGLNIAPKLNLDSIPRRNSDLSVPNLELLKFIKTKNNQNQNLIIPTLTKKFKTANSEIKAPENIKSLKLPSTKQINVPKIDEKFFEKLPNKYGNRNSILKKDDIVLNEMNFGKEEILENDYERRISKNIMPLSEIIPQNFAHKKMSVINFEDNQKSAHLIELKNFHRSTITKLEKINVNTDEKYLRKMTKEAEEEMKALQYNDEDMNNTSNFYFNAQENIIPEIVGQENINIDFSSIRLSFKKNQTFSDMKSPKVDLKKMSFIRQSKANLAPDIKLNFEKQKIDNELLKAPNLEVSLSNKQGRLSEAPKLTDQLFKKLIVNTLIPNMDGDHNQVLKFLGRSNILKKYKNDDYEDGNNLQMSNLSDEKLEKLGYSDKNTNLTQRDTKLFDNPVIYPPNINIIQNIKHKNFDLIAPDLGSMNFESKKEHICPKTLNKDFSKGYQRNTLQPPVFDNQFEEMRKNENEKLLKNEKSDKILNEDVKSKKYGQYPVLKAFMSTREIKAQDMGNYSFYDQNSIPNASFKIDLKSGKTNDRNVNAPSLDFITQYNVMPNPKAPNISNHFSQKSLLSNNIEKSTKNDTFDPRRFNVSTTNLTAPKIETSEIKSIVQSNTNLKIVDAPKLDFRSSISSKSYQFINNDLTEEKELREKLALNVPMIEYPDIDAIYQKTKKSIDEKVKNENNLNNKNLNKMFGNPNVLLKIAQNREEPSDSENERGNNSPSVSNNFIHGKKSIKTQTFFDSDEKNKNKEEGIDIKNNDQSDFNTRQSQKYDQSGTIVEKRYVSHKKKNNTDSKPKEKLEKIGLTDFSDKGNQTLSPQKVEMDKKTEADFSNSNENKIFSKFLMICFRMFSKNKSKLLKNQNSIKSLSDQTAAKNKLKHVYWTPIESTDIIGTVWDQLRCFHQGLRLSKLTEIFENKTIGAVYLSISDKRIEFLNQNLKKMFKNDVKNLFSGFKKLLMIDFSKNEVHLVQQFLNIAPNYQEIVELSELEEKSLKNFSFCSSWILVSASIPNYTLRLKSFILCISFDERLKKMNKLLDGYQKICQILLESQNFQKFLKACIEAGNRLNLDSFLHQIEGFNMFSIKALEDCQSMGKVSLLEYLICEFKVQDNGVIDTLNTLLGQIKLVIDSPFLALNKEVVEMRDTMNEMRMALENSANNQSKDKIFVSKFHNFFIKNAKSVVEIGNKANQTQNLLEEAFWFIGEKTEFLDELLEENKVLRQIERGLENAFNW